jgi:hypothetical protein
MVNVDVSKITAEPCLEVVEAMLLGYLQRLLIVAQSFDELPPGTGMIALDHPELGLLTGTVTQIPRSGSAL